MNKRQLKGSIPILGQKKRYLILGCGPTLKAAPLQENWTEIWGLNDIYKLLPDAGSICTRYFEMHDRNIYKLNKDKEHIKFLKSLSIPVYMTSKHDDIASSEAYPISRIVRAFGEEWWTSSIAYMLALAMIEKPDEIFMLGCDMESDDEYIRQRPAIQHLMSVARMMKVPVFYPKGTGLDKPPRRYGYHLTQECAKEFLPEDCVRLIGEVYQFKKTGTVTLGCKSGKIKKLDWNLN